MNEGVLTVSNARKHYDGTVALDGADLTLRKGEWLGLLGPNGAGKTTLVRAIAGRVRLDDGRLVLLGTELGDGTAAARAARARLGIVPQEIALYHFLTARENMEVFGSLCGLSGQELRDRVAWGLNVTGLTDRADDRTRTYSGGMKRRLNIACSVLHRPDVILLDEPTAGVDPQSRERIWEMLESLRAEGASLLLTSHQLDEVERVCDRIVIIDHGRVIARGTVTELIEETIGRTRQVILEFDTPPEPDDPLHSEGEIDGKRGTFAIQSVVHDLPALLHRCEVANVRVNDVHITSPTLQAVFIHLTGRELRE